MARKNKKPKKKVELVRAVCSFCGKENSQACRPSKIRKCDYLMCRDCRKSGVKVERAAGEIEIRTMDAAPGDWTGIDVRKPTEEEQRSINRAKMIRDIGIAQLKADKAKYN